MKPVHRTVLQMREQGKTYEEISKETGLVKSAISYIITKHFPKAKQAKITSKNTFAAWRDQHTAGKISQLRLGADLYYERLRSEAREKWLSMLRVYHDQSFIYFISGLYEGEGSHSHNQFELSNSDPALILGFLSFVRNVLKLPEEGFRVGLNIHQSMDREVCEAFWRQIIGRALDGVVQTDNRPQKKVHRHNKRRQYYGTLRVTVYKPMGLALALKEYCY